MSVDVSQQRCILHTVAQARPQRQAEERCLQESVTEHRQLRSHCSKALLTADAHNDLEDFVLHLLNGGADCSHSVGTNVPQHPSFVGPYLKLLKGFMASLTFQEAPALQVNFLLGFFLDDLNFLTFSFIKKSTDLFLNQEAPLSVAAGQLRLSVGEEPPLSDAVDLPDAPKPVAGYTPRTQLPLELLLNMLLLKHAKCACHAAHVLQHDGYSF